MSLNLKSCSYPWDQFVKKFSLNYGLEFWKHCLHRENLPRHVINNFSIAHRESWTLSMIPRILGFWILICNLFSLLNITDSSNDLVLQDLWRSWRWQVLLTICSTREEDRWKQCSMPSHCRQKGGNHEGSRRQRCFLLFIPRWKVPPALQKDINHFETGW